jgi:histone H3/H4
MKDDVAELCEEVLKDMATDVVLDDEALALVSKTGKAFVDKLMKDAKLVAEHAGREEITSQDVKLVIRLRETS